MWPQNDVFLSFGMKLPHVNSKNEKQADTLNLRCQASALFEDPVEGAATGGWGENFRLSGYAQ